MNANLTILPPPGEKIAIITNDLENPETLEIGQSIAGHLQRIRPLKKPEPKVMTLSEATAILMDKPDEFPIYDLIILVGDDFYSDQINFPYHLSNKGLFKKMAIITSSRLWEHYIDENTKNFLCDEANLNNFDESQLHLVILEIFSWYNNIDLATVGE